jgi:hypothetical protein
LVVRNRLAVHCRLSPNAPRTPASTLVATTWSNGGSPAIEFGSRQGLSGSAQPSSIADGARLLWPTLANSANDSLASKCRPSAGLKRS